MVCVWRDYEGIEIVEITVRSGELNPQYDWNVQGRTDSSLWFSALTRALGFISVFLELLALWF